MRQWYRIENKATTKDVADIYVYDQIGKSFWNDNAVDSGKFIKELKALPDAVKRIIVHVNSPGGSPFEATAIANALKAERTDRGREIEVRIDGLAASAATVITCVGSPIKMADNAMMMVHEPSGIAMGPSKTLRQTADALDAVRDAIVAAYQWVSKKTADELKTMMAETTWMTAKQALENGFATEIVEGAQVTACFSPEVLEVLGDLPSEHRAKVEALIKKPEPAPQPATFDEVAAAVEGAGLGLALARELVTAKLPLEQVTAKVNAAKAARDQALTREREIRACCDLAKLPELANGYVAGAMTVDAVKAHLAVMLGKLDRVEIDAGINPDKDKKTAPTVDVFGAYAALNQRK